MTIDELLQRLEERKEAIESVPPLPAADELIDPVFRQVAASFRETGTLIERLRFDSLG